MQFANDITPIDTASMAQLRSMFTHDELENIRKDRAVEQFEIRHNEFDLFAKKSHPQAHHLGRYWGSKNAY